jgi:hypothetical protein
LTLTTPEAPQWAHRHCGSIHAPHWNVTPGAQWRPLPGDVRPCQAVCQQARRWLDMGAFESVVYDPRAT